MWGQTEQSWDWLREQSGPAFVYSLNKIQQDTEYFKTQWQYLKPDKASHLFYSVKANPNMHLITRLNEIVDGFDVSSQIELEALRRLGISGDRITLSGPAKTDRCLKLAVEMGLRAIHLDSLEEFRSLIKLGSLPMTARISLESGASQKVGLPDRDIQTLLANSPDGFVGFHTYIGREAFSEKTIQWALDKMASFGKNFDAYMGAGLPGLAAFHQDGIWQQTVNAKEADAIHLEAGRALVNESGCYVAPILSIKDYDDGDRIVIIEGGFQHLATRLTSPKFGQQGIQVSIYRDGKKLAGDVKTTRIHGSLSIWNDLLLQPTDLPSDLLRGDVVTFSPCGAYGLTASANQFIGHTFPKEFLFDEAKGYEEIGPDRFKTYHNGFGVSHGL